MIIEILIAVLIVSLILMIINIVKHTFGYIFGISASLLVVFVIIVSIVGLDLARQDLLDSNKIILIENDVKVGYELGSNEVKEFLENSSEYQNIISKISEDGDEPLTNLVLQIKSLNESKQKDLIEVMKSYSKSGMLGKSILLLKIKYKKLLGDFELYPKSISTKVLKIVIG